MGRPHRFALTAIFAFVIDYVAVAGQDFFEEYHHKNQVRTPSEHLNDIPKYFDIKGENAIPKFNKYLSDIQDLATRKNVTIVYKVKVDALLKNKHKTSKKLRTIKKTKKYNIPLKKKSMKLSNFELILRKRANEFGPKQHYLDEISTATEKHRLIYTTRQAFIGKYKPEFGAVRSKYVKIIRPVKNTEFALET